MLRNYKVLLILFLVFCLVGVFKYIYSGAWMLGGNDEKSSVRHAFLLISKANNGIHRKMRWHIFDHQIEVQMVVLYTLGYYSCQQENSTNTIFLCIRNDGLFSFLYFWS